MCLRVRVRLRVLGRDWVCLDVIWVYLGVIGCAWVCVGAV